MQIKEGKKSHGHGLREFYKPTRFANPSKIGRSRVLFRLVGPSRIDRRP